MEEHGASPAADFARETKLIELPRPQNGKKVAVLIGAVPVPDLLVALDGIPGATVPADPQMQRTWEEVRNDIAAAVEPSRRIARAGVIAPVFAFDARTEGAAFWDDVHTENQTFIVAQIMALSGMTGEAAEKADKFSSGA